jgi:tripartite-type tricarboxylate transporter receptor subunit TctC
MISRFAALALSAASLALSLFAGSLALAVPAVAQSNFPAKPVRFIVPFPGGGINDVLARIAAEKLQVKWGQPIIVENKTGAGGSIGADAAAKSAPDGYTLFLSTNSPLTTNLALYPALGYDPVRDFEPVILAGENSLVLAANPKLPVKSVADLIALAKSKPGELNAATSGNGSTAHLSLATFNKMAGVSITHVPYRGGAPSLTAALAGDVELVFSDIVPAAPLVQDHRLNGLAMTGLRRAAVAPDIPTLDASGLRGFNVTAWIGLVVPKGTPADIVKKLNLEVGRAFKDPDFVAQMSKVGIDPIGSTPEEFAAFLGKEIPRWKQIVQDAGAKLE